jgi:serine/threonine-protein kinase
VGQQVGPFLVERIIARGGQGIVAQARDGRTGQSVALKLMLDDDPRSAKRFRREGQVLRGVQHPNLLRVLDAGALGAVPYLATELVEGEHLESVVGRQGLPSAERISELLGPVARALHACHQRGVVHRDIKPKNILVEATTGRPVLIDFGLVRAAPGSTQGGLELTGGGLSLTGEMVGTPGTMAPEQLDKNAEQGPATDVYGLGAVLYYLLSGRLPFEGDTSYNVVLKVMREEATDPRTLNPDISPAMAELVLRCLSKEPGDRPESALVFAEVLREAAAGESAPPPRRGGVLLGLVAAAVLGGGLVAGALALRPSHATLALTLDAPVDGAIVAGRELGPLEAGVEVVVERVELGAQVLSVTREGVAAELALEVTDAGRQQMRPTMWFPHPVQAPAEATVTVQAPGGGIRLGPGGAPLRDVPPGALRLPLGRHQLVVRAPDRRTAFAVVEGRPGASGVEVTLPPALRLRAETGGRVFAGVATGDLDGDGVLDFATNVCLPDEPNRWTEFPQLGWDKRAQLVAWSGRTGEVLWSYDGAPLNGYAQPFIGPFGGETRVLVAAIGDSRETRDVTALLLVLGLDGEELRRVPLGSASGPATNVVPVGLGDASPGTYRVVADVTRVTDAQGRGRLQPAYVATVSADDHRSDIAYHFGEPGRETSSRHGLTTAPVDEDGDGVEDGYAWSFGRHLLTGRRAEGGWGAFQAGWGAGPRLPDTARSTRHDATPTRFCVGWWTVPGRPPKWEVQVLDHRGEVVWHEVGAGALDGLEWVDLERPGAPAGSSDHPALVALIAPPEGEPRALLVWDDGAETRSLSLPGAQRWRHPRSFRPGDGRRLLAVASETSLEEAAGRVELWDVARGERVWRRETGTDAPRVEVADLDGDGRDELIILGRNSGWIEVVEPDL